MLFRLRYESNFSFFCKTTTANNNNNKNNISNSNDNGNDNIHKRLKWNIQNEIERGKARVDPLEKNHMEKFNVFICVAELKSDLNVNQSYAEHDIR